MKMEQIVPKRRHIKFRRRGIIQKKEYRTKKFFHPTIGISKCKMFWSPSKIINYCIVIIIIIIINSNYNYVINA